MTNLPWINLEEMVKMQEKDIQNKNGKIVKKLVKGEHKLC